MEKVQFNFVAICFMTGLLFTFVVCGCNLLGLHQQKNTYNYGDKHETELFRKANLVLQNKCVSCHASSKHMEIVPLDFSTELDFVKIGAVVPGNVDESPIINRLSSYKGEIQSIRNMPADEDLSAVEYQTLYNWVSSIKKNEWMGNDFIEKKIVCDRNVDVGVSVNQFLNFQQLKNTLVELFGDSLVEQQSRLLEVLSTEYRDDRGFVPSQKISGEFYRIFQEIDQNLARGLSSVPDLRTKALENCGSESSKDICLKTYLLGFAERVFRRPLTEREIENSKQLFSRSNNSEEGIGNVLIYQLLSPTFLYIFETGIKSKNGTQASHLTDFEIASRISYMISNRPPDNVLYAAAKMRKLRDKKILFEQVQRLLYKPENMDTLLDFFYYWLDMKTKFSTDILPNHLLDGLNISKLEVTSRQELKDYLYFVLLEKRLPFSQLFLNQRSFARDQQLAQIYGHSPVRRGLAQKMPSERQGILGRVPFLAIHTYKDAMIYRGKSVRNKLFCDDLPVPNVNIFTLRRGKQFPPEKELKTISRRQSLEIQTKDSSCQSCHSRLNPSGAIFEAFDPLGRHMKLEPYFDANGKVANQIPVVTLANVPISSVQDSVRMENLSDFNNFIAQSERSKFCFSWNLFSFYQKRQARKKDHCLVQQTFSELLDPNAPLIDVITTSILNATLVRKVEFID